MGTSESEIGLKKIMDMTRLMSVVLLGLHFYDSCHGFFKMKGWTHPIGAHVLGAIHSTGLFDGVYQSKLLTLLFLLLSLLGVKARKGVGFHYRVCATYLIAGILLYFVSMLAFWMPLGLALCTVVYMVMTGSGYLLIMTGGTLISRVIRQKLSGGVFNDANETFPQEERLLTNPYSVNLPTRYRLRNKTRKGWINIINGFRGGILLMGLPGSGKTLIAKEIIKQQIAKGYAMFIHDFKYPDLTHVAYNSFLKHRQHYKALPTFQIINFEDIHQRCNPLLPQSIRSITDAAAASRAILLGLNQEWIAKQGNFWTESSINFTTALIWFLRIYQDGKYCTLPHVIELAQTPLDKLFPILAAEPSLEVLVNPFIRAYEEDAGKQLIGQISGAAISLGTLASAPLYYVLSGNDFDMIINNAAHPKIVCIANNPQVSNIYSAVISLYLNTLQKLLREQQQQPCGILLEEFANISWYNADKFLSVCRSYLVNVTLVIQDASQLLLHYGEKQARVILSMVGNIISGQVTGESAKQLSDRFGRIMQDRQSLTVNSNDTSFSQSKQLDHAIPQSAIAALSAGEVVGVVADNPDQRIPQKMFHGQLMHDFKALNKEAHRYQALPKNRVSKQTIDACFVSIKQELKAIVEEETVRILNTPGLVGRLTKK